MKKAKDAEKFTSDNGAFTGWKPLGFFQLVHRSAFDIYPEGSLDATHGDLVFAKLWDRKDRIFIPEIMGIHLMTEEYKGMNHQGRKSSLFDYSKKTSCIQKIIDKIIIQWHRFCLPNYYGKVCCLCKIVNWFK